MNPGPDIECPVCHVEAGLRCRTLKTGKSTDVHQDRYTALYDRNERRWRERDGRIVLPPPSELCTCGNRFDGDNLCMLSACEQET